MTTLLHKFSLQSAKFTGEVTLALLIIWLAVIACTITSVLAQPFTTRQRFFWIATITFVPVIGLLAYLPFSFRREDLPQIFLMKRSPGKKDPAGGKRLTQGSRG